MIVACPACATRYDFPASRFSASGTMVRCVEQQHVIVHGTRVISIKGVIVNVSDEDRKVPSHRFILKNGAADDIYAWTIDSGIRPLRPGDITTFTTRFASPPPAAEDVQIRFARADEIGVNPGHVTH